MAHTLARPLAFDIEGAAFKRDPHPTFARMREAGPVIPMRLPFVGKAWVTTTYAATEEMVKANDRFVQEARHAGKPGTVAGMQWWMPKRVRLLADNMLLKDEPDHRRLRTLVNQAFQRRGIQSMRGDIEARADRLLDAMAARNETDLVAGYARRLPLIVISDLLGLPETDRGLFEEMSKAAFSVTKALDAIKAFGAIGRLVAYVEAQIEAARHAPRPGLIAELVRAEAQGERLSPNELVSMVVILLVAGFETTTHLISGSIVALQRRSEARAWMMADPSQRAERAVEELLRYVSPVQSTKPRFVAQDCEFHGAQLKRGDLILGLIAAANADPAVFEAPHELRIERFPNPHLSFSSGIHFCLGMQLARVEAQSALVRLFTRFPDLEIPPYDALAQIERFGLRGVKELPATLTRLREAA